MLKDIEKYLFNKTIDNIVIALIGVVVIWILLFVIQKLILSKVKENEDRYRAKKISRFIGYFITLVFLSIIYSDKFGKFTVALGVAGAGIAFALQQVIVSFAGWLTLLFGRFYKSGDRIQLAGIKGDVMDIGVLTTTIMEIGQWVEGDLYNGRIVQVSNSFMFKEPVFNYSGEFPYLWDEIKLPIQFGSNYDKVKEILSRTGKEITEDYILECKNVWTHLENKYRLEDTQTEPMVSMTVNSNWVEFTLRYIVSYKKRRITKTELFTRILKDIDSTKGEIKFPSTSFDIDSVPEIKVSINDAKSKNE